MTANALSLIRPLSSVRRPPPSGPRRIAMPESSPTPEFILSLLEVVHDDDKNRHLKPIKRYDLRADEIGPSAAFLGMAIQLAFERYVRWRDPSYPPGEAGRAQFIADAAQGKWPECFP